MGGGSTTSVDWATYTTTKASKSAAPTVDALYNSRSLKDHLNPKLIKNGIRESRDFPGKKDSLNIIVGLDVTGSMDVVLDVIARQALPTIGMEMLNPDRKFNFDPQIMYMAIGDSAVGDKAPLQVTQYEADISITNQVLDLYLERGGGGNGWESYTLAWYFAAMHTVTDAFEKRGKKGYLFTIGDERPNPNLTRHEINTFIGGSVEKDFTSKELYDMVSQKYNVYHITLLQGSNGRSETVHREWKELLGDHAIFLSSYQAVAETIVSIIQLGESNTEVTAEEVSTTWSGDKSVIVSNAIKDIKINKTSSSEVVVF